MAAELEKDGDVCYDGVKLDMFNIGVILHYMCYKDFPIVKRAIPTDLIYRLVFKNKFDKFFKHFDY